MKLLIKRHDEFKVKLNRLILWHRLTGILPPEFRNFCPKNQDWEEPEILLEKRPVPYFHGWEPFYRLDDLSPWQEIALRNWEDE